LLFHQQLISRSIEYTTQKGWAVRSDEADAQFGVRRGDELS